MAERSAATEMSDTGLDETRVEAYELTDAEMAKLDKLAGSSLLVSDRSLQARAPTPFHYSSGA